MSFKKWDFKAKEQGGEAVGEKLVRGNIMDKRRSWPN